MTNRITNLEMLRKELRGMRRGDLLIIAERAIELVPKATLKALVGDYVHVDDVRQKQGRHQTPCSTKCRRSTSIVSLVATSKTSR
jgi:hypothetical protein